MTNTAELKPRPPLPAFAVQRSEHAARQAHKELTRRDHPRSLAATIWAYYEREMTASLYRQAGPHERVERAQAAVAAMLRIGEIRGAVCSWMTHIDGGGADPVWLVTPALETNPNLQVMIPQALAILESDHPEIWQDILAARKAHGARTAIAEAHNERQRAESNHQARVGLLERLRAAGVELTLDKSGHITAPAGSNLSAHDREMILAHKPTLVEMLQAEAAARAEAAKPLVLA